MAIFNLFSKRQKKLRGEILDVYSYSDAPQGLRVQIVHIVEDALGQNRQFTSANVVGTAYTFIHATLCREYGVFSIGNNNESDRSCVLNILLQTEDADKFIDVVELFFKYIDVVIRESWNYTQQAVVKCKPDEAIEELNQRFMEHAFGYQFSGGEIIRVDSTFIHSEIVKPTISLLANKSFSGANDEYLKAHEHYRHGRNKECLSECLKAFESTMKIICKAKGWEFSDKETSKKLIQICFQNELVPSFTQNQFTSLQNLLESGIPTIRNRLGGHGQGSVPQKVDDGMTRYALNLTGANLIFIIEQSGIR